MRKQIITISVEKEVNVVEEFCSLPSDYEDGFDGYAQDLCDEQKKENPNKNYAYELDESKFDDMSGETIGYIYEVEKWKIETR